MEIKSALNCLDKGIYLKMDESGNLWMKKCHDLADIFVYSMAIPNNVVVLEQKFKNVLDLNLIKCFIKREILKENFTINDLFVNSIIFIQVYFKFYY